MVTVTVKLAFVAPNENGKAGIKIRMRKSAHRMIVTSKPLLTLLVFILTLTLSLVLIYKLRN